MKKQTVENEGKLGMAGNASLSQLSILFLMICTWVCVWERMHVDMYMCVDALRGLRCGCKHPTWKQGLKAKEAGSEAPSLQAGANFFSLSLKTTSLKMYSRTWCPELRNGLSEALQASGWNHCLTIFSNQQSTQSKRDVSQPLSHWLLSCRQLSSEE